MLRILKFKNMRITTSARNHIFKLSEFIEVITVASKDIGWPADSPFTLRFKQRNSLTAVQSSAIKGSGVYMISVADEVVYIGLYIPEKGNIINDRWGRHLQTITGRGYNIGFGGSNNSEARCAHLCAAVNCARENTSLVQALRSALTHSQADRYRDTGYCTTANRLRFACENWDCFGTAQGQEILKPLTFWLFRIRTPQSPEQAAKDVKAIEKKILQLFKPVCNAQYQHSKHNEKRACNTVKTITNEISLIANEQTGEAINCIVQIKGA